MVLCCNIKIWFFLIRFEDMKGGKDRNRKEGVWPERTQKGRTGKRRRRRKEGKLTLEFLSHQSEWKKTNKIHVWAGPTVSSIYLLQLRWRGQKGCYSGTKSTTNIKPSISHFNQTQNTTSIKIEGNSYQISTFSVVTYV